MADTEVKKFINDIWASDSTAERVDPEDVGITRTVGWPEAYEQIGSGSEPERLVWQQKSREWDGGFAERTRYGALIPWDATINYYQFARVGSGIHKYISTVATGPAHGNATDPATSGQSADLETLVMADQEAKKILGNLWASGTGGQRTDPDDPNLPNPVTRTEGYDDQYSMAGGLTPPRRPTNQKFREWDGGVSDSYRYGGTYPYDAEVDFYVNARCFIGLVEYR